MHALVCLRNLPPKAPTLDPPIPIDLDAVASLLADRAGGKDFLHRCPVGLDPPAIVAAVAVRGYADLRELELCAAGHLFNVEDSYGVVIRPPARGAPCLNDFLARPQREIDT
jgi:hypothetical protein